MARSLFQVCRRLRHGAIGFFLALLMILIIPLSVMAKAGDPRPPARTVKLVFIHHSCGQNWLDDDHGKLGRALAENNYFVSDTNYGWGPSSIGDRTDITDWPEWFIGPNSRSYLKALYKTSEKLSPFRRDLSDPGGENEIIMFKSCFPNSNLAGKPADVPARGAGLTVSNAKWIYNELLQYFATRPDKLFIVVTAPPVQDQTYAVNARAFNTWLVRDWLENYKGNNVAVFDFYNVLTSPRNHHRFRNGAIEHITNRGRDTLYYPTNGDDHPSPVGNQKATKEFVSLLNVYYHRWKQRAPAALPPPPQTKPAPLPSGEDRVLKQRPLPPPTIVGGVIDNFESGANEWVVFADEEKDTRLICGPDKATSHSGTVGLRIEYDIAPDSWATCSLVYPSPRDWSGQLGLSVYLHAKRIGQRVVVVAYQGDSPDNLYHFEFNTQINQEGVTDWQRVDISWDRLVQPPWQGDSSARFDPRRAMGVAFAFEAAEGGRNGGRLWVDDVIFLSAVPKSSPTH